MANLDRHPVVSHAQWLEARKAFMKREKELTRLRDQLAEERRALPWERIEKPYAFDGPRGRESLGDLFDGKSQLLVYHFMYPKSWEEGCKSCSFWMDSLERNVVHLAARDLAVAVVSISPLAKLEAFRKRLGWTFHWVSSEPSDFNRDFGVTFTDDEIAQKLPLYNYGTMAHPVTEGPGISVFYRNPKGEIFHTYSTYTRGLDPLNAAYQLLDLVPKGRDEDALPYTMSWLRHRDRY
ncbi:MAG TPA: thioredoxin family protein [Myxococcota bacterium]|nr:thioredoxin family protein [Myxococcota bacterium]